MTAGASRPDIQLTGGPAAFVLSGQEMPGRPMSTMNATQLRPRSPLHRSTLSVGGRRSLADHLRAWGGTCYHPVRTCAMGSDDAVVVDPELPVRA
ncbi:hypothetical protein SAMN05421869_10531 [Nonomuraea jiangxiensis]|uniref:Glucose-methanol-choline oxidoreductase C-terminal domain-containing protein n=1 Tax=Nonomuraea jiangxiensis TaxID=633440 RepID=A0A1G8JBY8_9ACTN|nr:hypothetical protein SAMN05421869_10531 [Nonomuraea jiangxiensis]